MLNVSCVQASDVKNESQFVMDCGFNPSDTKGSLRNRKKKVLLVSFLLAYVSFLTFGRGQGTHNKQVLVQVYMGKGTWWQVLFSSIYYVLHTGQQNPVDFI